MLLNKKLFPMRDILEFGERQLPYEIRVWEPGEVLGGKAYGIDSETERFRMDDPAFVPKIVILSAFCIREGISWLVSWENIPAFMQHLKERKIRQYYFNLPYDAKCIDEESLLESMDMDLVVDLGVRFKLSELATRGYVRMGYFSLSGLFKLYLQGILEKGTEEDGSVRYTYNRELQELSMEHIRYGAADPVVTALLASVIKPQPTEELQSKASVVLDNITRNGLPVNLKIFNHYKTQLTQELSQGLKDLQTFGYPAKIREEGEIKPADEVKAVVGKFAEEAYTLFKEWSYKSLDVRQILLHLVFDCTARHPLTRLDAFNKFMNEFVLGNSEALRSASLLKRDWARFQELAGLTQLEADGATLCRQGEALLLKRAADSVLLYGHTSFEVLEDLSMYARVRDYWREFAAPAIGPDKYMGIYISNMQERFPALELNKTKTGIPKYGASEKWRFEDAGITDPFMQKYWEVDHLGHLLQHYMKDSLIYADGKFHPRFELLVRTGRTSSSGPNAQNYPGGKDGWNLRNMIQAPDGFVICSTDYSQLELAALAQDCLMRFGESKLAMLINNDIDAHSWMASRLLKLIDNDNDFDDRMPDYEKAAWKTWFAEELVPKAEPKRKLAKSLNFGLGGGMGVKTFYKQVRASGAQITFDEVQASIADWFAGLPEMRLHMQVDEVPGAEVREFSTWASRKEDGTEQDDEDVMNGIDRTEQRNTWYTATTMTGRKRNMCSFCAACNYKFQGFKQAG